MACALQGHHGNARGKQQLEREGCRSGAPDQVCRFGDNRFGRKAAIRELMPELNAVAMPLVRAVEYSDEGSRIEQDVARPNHASVAPVVSAYPDRDLVVRVAVRKANRTDVGRTALSHGHRLRDVAGRRCGEVLLEGLANQLRLRYATLAREPTQLAKHFRREAKGCLVSHGMQSVQMHPTTKRVPRIHKSPWHLQSSHGDFSFGA